jgi:hypothetical protein
MLDARYFVAQAARCRELLKVARVPEVIEQLQVWAAEFDAASHSASREGRGADRAHRERA